MKEENIEIKRNDLRVLMICAFRYSLGRKTYMPGLVTELIRNNSKIFNKQDWKVFLEDIEFHRNFNNLGDDCDVATWNKFSEFCNIKFEEFKKR